MEKKIIISRRFRKNVSPVYEYLLKESIQQRLPLPFLTNCKTYYFIIQNSETGKPSQIKPEIRSLLLQPHNRIYYRLSNNKVALLCLFDMRKKNKPY